MLLPLDLCPSGRCSTMTKLLACVEKYVPRIFSKPLKAFKKALGDNIHTPSSLQTEGDTYEYRWSIGGCPNM